MSWLKYFYISKGSGFTPAHFLSLEVCVPTRKTAGTDRKSEKRIIPSPSDEINNSPPGLRLVLSETWGNLLSRAWAHPWLLNRAALFPGKYWIHTFKIKLEAKSFEQSISLRHTPLGTNIWGNFQREYLVYHLVSLFNEGKQSLYFC